MSREQLYVTASHRLPSLGTGVGSRPYGTQHARRVGAPWTLCGQPALHWPMFYEIRFDPHVLSSCEDCAGIVKALDYF